MRPVRIIALMNQKGGVGKTTTTVNLAAAFAKAGRSTLVVDLDPQGHASLHLGVDATDTKSVYDALLNPGDDVAGIVREIAPDLGLLPSNTDLAAAEIELGAEPDRLHRLGKVLASMGEKYEFVLLDCPPSLGLLTLNGLAAAREVLIPMQAHFLALQGVSKLLETVRMVNKQVNPKLRVLGVALCMHDPSSTHVREVVADLEKFFEHGRLQETPWKLGRVLRPAIRRNIKLAECPSFGQTIFDYAPEAAGAEDYMALATQMLKEWDAMLGKKNETAGAAAVVIAQPGQAAIASERSA